MEPLARQGRRVYKGSSLCPVVPSRYEAVGPDGPTSGVGGSLGVPKSSIGGLGGMLKGCITAMMWFRAELTAFMCALVVLVLSVGNVVRSAVVAIGMPWCKWSYALVVVDMPWW